MRKNLRKKTRCGFLVLKLVLDALVARDLVVVVEQDRLDHGRELHVQVEEVNRERHRKRRGADAQYGQRNLDCFFHLLSPFIS